MSRPPLPAPPPSFADEISSLPTLSVPAAVEWLGAKGVDVTETYLVNAVRKNNLQAQIVCGKRRLSTAELYRFIVSRPTSTRRGPSPTERKAHAAPRR